MNDTDLRFADITSQLRRENFVSSNMPSFTPGDGIGAGTVALFLALAARDLGTEHEHIAAIIAGCLVACFAIHRHGKLREVRNDTEQIRIEAEHAPTYVALEAESAE